MSAKLELLRRRDAEKRAETYWAAVSEIRHKTPDTFTDCRDDPRGVTLAVAGSNDLGKTYEKQGDGTFKKVSTSANETGWRFYPLRLPDHAAFGALLEAVERQSNAALVRAAVHPDPRLHGLLRRQWHASERHDSEPGGALVPRCGHWLPVDLDKVPMPEGCSYSEPDKIVAAVVAGLPQPFAGVRCVWQLSSSSGLTATDTVGLHLWFFSQEPVTCRAWHRVSKLMQGRCQGWDPAAAVGTQINFTAGPTVVGGNDPLEGCRVGVFEGDRKCVDLGPLVEEARAKQAAEAAARAARRKQEETASRTDGPTIVGRYLREWRSIIDRHLGDGAGRKGYNRPVYWMVRAAVRCGERDFDRLAASLRKIVWTYAERSGDLQNRSREADLERYLGEVELLRWFENALAYGGTIDGEDQDND